VHPKLLKNRRLADKGLKKVQADSPRPSWPSRSLKSLINTSPKGANHALQQLPSPPTPSLGRGFGVAEDCRLCHQTPRPRLQLPLPLQLDLRLPIRPRLPMVPRSLWCHRGDRWTDRPPGYRLHGAGILCCFYK
jgi:hypothetical protein